MKIETERLQLHLLAERHADAFAALHAEPRVMADLGGPIERAAALLKLSKYQAAWREFGTARWAVEMPDGAFIGYAGVMPRMAPEHPLGPHFEIGWRFFSDAWGNGYATEAARASLGHAVEVARVREIISYTAADNLRSQGVMRRLGLLRVPARDFTEQLGEGRQWRALVWMVTTGKR